MNLEWKNEPDFIAEVDEITGYQYFILRIMKEGHLCGYVEVPSNHPLYNINMEKEGHYDIVHGGITFDEFIDLSDDQNFEIGDRIKEYIRNKNIKKIKLVGFDCNHSGDLTPQRYYENKDIQGRSYRNIKFLIEECKKLCNFLKEKEKKSEIKNSMDRELKNRKNLRLFKELAEDCLFLNEKANEFFISDNENEPIFKRARIILLNKVTEILKDVKSQILNLEEIINNKIKNI